MDLRCSSRKRWGFSPSRLVYAKRQGHLRFESERFLAGKIRTGGPQDRVMSEVRCIGFTCSRLSPSRVTARWPLVMVMADMRRSKSTSHDGRDTSRHSTNEGAREVKHRGINKGNMIHDARPEHHQAEPRQVHRQQCWRLGRLGAMFLPGDQIFRSFRSDRFDCLRWASFGELALVKQDTGLCKIDSGLSVMPLDHFLLTMFRFPRLILWSTPEPR
jgi:hypothetical protein